MSTTQPTGKESPDANGDETDIKQEFHERLVERYPECDTAAEALAKAEQEPSTTDPDDRATCPACFRTGAIGAKPGGEAHDAKPGSRKCAACNTHLQHPAAGHDFEGDLRPCDPRREIVPVTVGSASYYRDPESATGGQVVDATAAEVVARGLAPRGDAPQPCECAMCGQPTFGAIDGSGEPVCADCVVVNGTTPDTTALDELRAAKLRGEGGR